MKTKSVFITFAHMVHR